MAVLAAGVGRWLWRVVMRSILFRGVSGGVARSQRVRGRAWRLHFVMRTAVSVNTVCGRLRRPAWEFGCADCAERTRDGCVMSAARRGVRGSAWCVRNADFVA
ncbi:hypothetical protein PF003_g4351 [Phytophthora fragariae]|nr:hypothetical protein PF003_g4351 [Phytophthora fragariae]